MTETTTNEQAWKPKLGEWCLIEPGNGYHSRFAKVINPEQCPDRALVLRIDEEIRLDRGFRFFLKANLINITLLKPILTTDAMAIFGSVPTTDIQVVEAIKEFYRNRALAAFKERLEQTLAEIN